MESGPVLFHIAHTFNPDGTVVFPPRAAKLSLPIGAGVKFLDCYLEGPEYSCISTDNFMRQAAAVWTCYDQPVGLVR